MRFFNAASAIVLGLASVAHGHKQIIDREVDQSASTSAPISASASHVPGGVFITTTSAEPTAPVTITVTVSSSVSSSSSSKQESSIATSVLASSADTVPHRQPPRFPTAQPPQTPRRPQDQGAPERVSITASLTDRNTSDVLPDCGPSLCPWLWGIHVSPGWQIPLCRPRSEAAQALSQDAVSSMNTVVESVRLLGWIEK
ncbi:hypothetical protein TRIATDRAFT_317345 [Trichoderma atroviride IMI 206040]|uniref:Uncharacterized protein n=1 Tax=Hypocrea atroviridis (strain ATCC 20476 / IMI 206040) TaxID=452589 RepID=G9NSE2_HYPAI|nr:uncharacterized protein TRIATDRAFT_317345 [Trichoderma atroviride IMI 206040]EHK46343.1 hypothetical protein TRIATDRAFT_317345 [Trichoderma atroviride IMI 206040]